MHTITAVLALALIVIVPAPAAAQSEPTTPPIVADVHVYDYTQRGTPWTLIIIATIEEFNAVRPPTAPQLSYVTAPGDTDCRDLSDDVLELSGIIVCDTNRPEEYPANANTPVEGWSGAIGWPDDDTAVIVLNNITPNGASVLEWGADNTVCHEMMHAFTGVEDAYGSDPWGSCVWGELLSPGPTDVRLMRELYTAPVVELSLTDEEPSLWERTKAAGRKAREQVCGAISHVDVSVIWEDTKSTGREMRDRVGEVLPDVEIDVPDVDFGLADVDIPEVDIDMPDVSLPKCKDASTANS